MTCMHIEAYCPSDRRGTYEKIRCRTEDGLTEFLAEVARIEKLRAGESEWDPVVIRLLYGDTVFKRKEIA